MPKNKKVINATSVTSCGIKFRSKTEERVYKKLVSLGYSPKYESKKYVLWEGIVPKFPLYIDGIPQLTKKDKPKKLRDWTYTPDFILEKNGYTMIIEVKGNPNDLYPYTRKLFLKHIESLNKTYFFEVRTIRGLLITLETIEKLWEPTTSTTSKD